MIKLLFVAICLVTGTAAFAQQKKDCQELKVQVVITPAGASSNGSIQVVSEDDQQDLRINLLGTGENDDKTDIKESEVVSLPAGNYDLIITDRKNRGACPLHKKIKVE